MTATVPGTPTQQSRHRGRKAALLLSTVALVVSACGSGDQPDEAGTTAESRTIVHEFGETEVPADPQRVVVLDSRLMVPTAALLDVPVVGLAGLPYGERDTLPFVDEEAVTGAEDVGFNEINLEKVAALRPDLILGGGGAMEDGRYEQFQQIAPTVAFDFLGFAPWKEALRRVAEVFGGTERIEEGIADYEARVQELRAELGERQGTEVTFANLRALDDIRIYPGEWCSGSVLEEVGFTRPPDQQGEETISLSIERLGDLDAEMLVYFVGSPGTDPQDAGAAEDTITSHPLWDTLEVTRAGQAYAVDQTHWFSCGSLQAQNLVLDDLGEIIRDSSRQ